MKIAGLALTETNSAGYSTIMNMKQWYLIRYHLKVSSGYSDKSNQKQICIALYFILAFVPSIAMVIFENLNFYSAGISVEQQSKLSFIYLMLWLKSYLVVHHFTFSQYLSLANNMIQQILQDHYEWHKNNVQKLTRNASMLTSAAVILWTYDSEVENSETLDSVESQGNSLVMECEKWCKMSTNCAALFILVHI